MRWPVDANYPDDLFRGTAEVYVRFRPAYPAALLDHLVTRAGVGPGARLLDLGCGTGQVAIPLSDRFAQVWAVDLEPEMVEVGRRNAADAGADNIRWSIGRAEDVDAPAGHFRLVSAGNAFQRLDRRLIACRCLEWLEPGGCFAAVGGENPWSGGQSWQVAVAAVIADWTAPDPSGASDPGPRLTHEEVLLEAGFVDVAPHRFPTPHAWTPDTVIGYMRTMAFLHGVRASGTDERLEAEVRRAILAVEPEGNLRQDIPFWSVVGTRP
jgi:SAM-dependent methyltransferase